MESATLDVVFPVAGRKLPWDHSYALYSSLCRHVPDLHRELAAGIFPINGAPGAKGILKLSPSSALRIRVSEADIHRLGPLAHAELDLDGYEFGLGGPTLEPLVPACSLFSPWVTFKGYTQPEPFLEKVASELAAQGIEANFGLVSPRKNSPREGKKGAPKRPYVARTRIIKKSKILGFALLIQELSAEASLRLSRSGLGGRRRMGGGLFRPTRSR